MGVTMKVLITLSFMLLSWVALAQHKIIEMNPPKAKPYLNRQIERMDLVKAHKLKGYIGEEDNGLLAIRETKGLSAKQIERMKTMVSEENKDRQGVYDEIVKFNKLSDKEREILIRSAYETSRNIDKKGIYYKEKGQWLKRF